MASELSCKRFTAPATSTPNMVIPLGFSDAPKGSIWHSSNIKTLNSLLTNDHLLATYGALEEGGGAAGIGKFCYIWDEYNIGTTDNRVPYGATGGNDHQHMLTGVNYWTYGLRHDPFYGGSGAGESETDIQNMVTPQFANHLGGVLAFAGSDVDVACGTTADSSAATIAVSSLSFTPDLVFIWAEGSHAQTAAWHGVSLYNGSAYKHRSLSIRATDNVGTTATDCYVSNDYSCCKLNSSGALEDGYVADTFTSTGFTIRRNFGAGEFMGFNWVAIRFGDGVDLVDVETPAATGEETITGLGFVPKGLIEIYGPATALNTTYNGMGYSSTIYVQDEDITNQCGFSEDNVGTSAVGAIVGDEFRLYDDDATLLGQADTYTMVDDGFKKDWQTVPATARKGFAIGFGGGRDDGGGEGLEGTIAGASTLSGGLSIGVPLSGSIDAASVVSGDLSIGISLSGSIDAASALSGDLSIGFGLAGSIDATSVLAGDLAIGVPLGGSIDAVSALAGGLAIGVPLGGSIDGISGLAGDLATGVNLAGSIDATSALSGDLAIGVNLSGSIDAVSSLAGGLSIGVGISGTISGTSALSGDLDVGSGLAGSIDATSVLAGDLSIGVPLSGSIDAVSALSGNLLVGSGLSGRIDAASVLAGDLSIGIGLSGRIDATSVLAGGLDVGSGLSGTITGTSTLSGGLAGTPDVANVWTFVLNVSVRNKL